MFFEIDDRGVLSGIFSKKRAVAHDFLDIVHHAVQVPLRVHFGFTAQGKPVHAL